MGKKINRLKIIGLFIFLFLLTMLFFGKHFLKDSPSTRIPNILSSTRATLKTTAYAQVMYPSQILDLTNWKLTLPIGLRKNATEIKQPEIALFKLDPWFIPEGNGVRFRAPVNGVTTSGSDYPRSELREMTNNGKDKAKWSSNNGTHTLIVTEAITAVPQKKPHVVSAQIHDSENDILVIRLEYPRLYVNVNGKNVYTLDNNYTLGKLYSIKFVATNKQTMVYYNNETSPSYTLRKDYSGAYFKAGAYTQSNCRREKSSQLCNSNNYGEVIIYYLAAIHS